MPLLIKEARTVTQTQPNKKKLAETLTGLIMLKEKMVYS